MNRFSCHEKGFTKSIMIFLIILLLSINFTAIAINVNNKEIFIENITLKDEDFIYYYDKETAGWMGFGPACACDGWKSAIRLTQEELSPYNEWNLTGVNILRHGDGEHSGTIEIFGEGTTNEPGPIITSVPYYFNESIWYRVNLNELIPIKDHNEIWIAVVWHTKEPDIYPHAVDNYYPVIEKSDWIYLPGSNWSELRDYGFYFSWCMEAIVQRNGINHPPEKPKIDGPLNGKPRKEYTYTVTSYDPDSDNVSYFFDWGDDSYTFWTEFVPSGTPVSRSHSWACSGTYTIRVKAKDEYGMEGDWKILVVTMPRNKTVKNFCLFRFLEQFPILNKVLSHIIN